MPGLKQLQQFNSDIMNLGDEAKIRAARGEKPVLVKIPKTVEDKDDSDDFLNGLPALSEEEQAQADAAEKEREREANDFSDFMGDDEEKEDAPKAVQKQEAEVPDMSGLLPSGGDMDLGDFDLSDFEDNTPEPEPEPEPKEVAIEDMDLDSLLAFSETPKEEEPEEESIFNPAPAQKTIDTPTVDVSEDLFSSDAPAQEDSLFGPSADTPSEPDGTAFDTSLFDMPQEQSEEELESLPELNEESLANSLGGIGELNDVDSIPEPQTADVNISDFDTGNDSLGDMGDLGLPMDSQEPAPASKMEDVSLPEEFDLSDIPTADNLPEESQIESFDFNLPESDAAADSIPEISDDVSIGESIPQADDISAEPEGDENSLADLGLDDFNFDAPSEDIPETASEESELPADLSTEDFSTDVSEPAADVATSDFDSLTDAAEPAADIATSDFDFSTDAPEAGAMDSADAGLSDLPDFDMDLPDPNAEFDTTESVSLNDDVPVEFNEVSDADSISEPVADAGQDVSDSMDFGMSDDAGMEIPSADDGSLSTDDFSADSMDFGTDDSNGGDNSLSMDFGTDDFNVDSMDNGSFGTESLDPSIFDGGSGDVLSPEEDVPEELPSESMETFDTSDINDLDFSGEQDSDDFALGSLDGTEGDDEFSIPGFSDTVTANMEKKKPVVQTPDFSGAADISEEDKPKNTFTDNEYKRFLKNLATYPLNVRIALEDFVVKNEFTDDAIFAVLEKVLRKAPARQVATELEKLLDITLDVPRDFERRSAAEYEAYKKSVEYQLKNKIIPGAILTTAATILVFCIFTLVNNFIYKPVKAASFYKQGYSLLEDNQYPQSLEKFNQALTFRPVKKWFYTYAEGYRNHKQYDRSRMMYNNILKRYNHEKKAGLDWARMEFEDLYNYEESERILKREVLDYHINDPEGILALGDLYLEWATDSDPEKFPLAKHNYDLLIELHGSDNLNLSRQMRYFIRTDNLRQVLMYKEIFMGQKKGLNPADEIELSGYMLDKRFGKLRPSEDSLRSKIEDVRKLLERALKSSPENAIALYNMGRYFVETNNGKSAARLLQASIDAFEKQTKRNKNGTYKFINAYRLLGEEMRNEKEYLTAENLYGKGIEIFENENESSGFASDENVGRLYADLADLDYFVSADNDAALMHYESAVNNKYDTSSVRYRIGYIQYQNRNYPAALGSFIRSQDTSGNDMHLLLALANTLSLSNDNQVARGYYEKLLDLVEVEKQKYGAFLIPQNREDHNDIVDTYMKANNNLGVTLSRIASATGNSTMNAKAIVCFQESARAWDILTRNQKTMIRLEGSNLAEQNVRYISHPISDYSTEIYTEIPRMLYGEEGLK